MAARRAPADVCRRAVLRLTRHELNLAVRLYVEHHVRCAGFEAQPDHQADFRERVGGVLGREKRVDKAILDGPVRELKAVRCAPDVAACAIDTEIAVIANGRVSREADVLDVRVLPGLSSDVAPGRRCRQERSEHGNVFTNQAIFSIYPWRYFLAPRVRVTLRAGCNRHAWTFTSPLTKAAADGAHLYARPTSPASVYCGSGMEATGASRRRRNSSACVSGVVAAPRWRQRSRERHARLGASSTQAAMRARVRPTRRALRSRRGSCGAASHRPRPPGRTGGR